MIVHESHYPHWRHIVSQAHEGRGTVPIAELTHQFSQARFGNTRFETVWGSLGQFPGRSNAPRCVYIKRRQVVRRSVPNVLSNDGCAGCILFSGDSASPCKLGINPLQ